MRRSVLGVLVALLSMLAAAVPDATFAQATPCPTQPSNAFEYVNFAGSWERHGMRLDIGQLGCGTLAWRTYRWCPPDRAENCDRVQDGTVRFGGLTEFALRAPHGTASTGRIMKTSAPARFAERDIALVLNDDGTLTVEWHDQRQVFCRTWAWVVERCG